MGGEREREEEERAGMKWEEKTESDILLSVAMTTTLTYSNYGIDF